jgi:hypothetical protein
MVFMPTPPPASQPQHPTARALEHDSAARWGRQSDAEIARLMHALYGLTEEEIGSIEG